MILQNMDLQLIHCNVSVIFLGWFKKRSHPSCHFFPAQLSSCLSSSFSSLSSMSLLLSLPLLSLSPPSGVTPSKSSAFFVLVRTLASFCLEVMACFLKLGAIPSSFSRL